MRRISITLAALATVVITAHADVYKSVDAQGQVRYSDQWSPGATLLKGDHNQQLIDPNANTSADQKKPSAPNDHTPADDAAKQAAQKQVNADLAAARAVECKRLQDQYDKLIHARRIYQTDSGPTGERQFMSDAQADAERVKTRAGDGRRLQCRPRRLSVRSGFLGLGAMGAHMARNLHRAGLLQGVWNRTTARSEALAAELGCQAAPTPAALAQACEVLVLCVAADQDVLEVIAAMRPGLRAGQLVIDCSTVSAATALQAAATLQELDVQFLDCPVSGGVEGARDGTLAMMCGGDAAAFARAQPVLAVLGRTITHFGGSGSGQAAKATNQIMCAGIIQAVAEAMAFAQAHGCRWTSWWTPWARAPAAAGTSCTARRT